MKRLLFILFLLPVWLFAQPDGDGTLREIDWKTYVENVQYLTDSTYQFDASPIDFNDKGSWTREIGNYFVDFVGNRYLITGSDATTITVLDEYRKWVAPQSGQIGRVYQSVLGGYFKYVGGVDITSVDELSRWKIQAADNELMARKIQEGRDSIVWGDDYVLRFYMNGVLSDSVLIEMELKKLKDVNTTTPLTTKGQILVWDQLRQVFDLNYNIWPDLISNEAYSSAWDGVDSTAASKNAVYDKLSQFESLNYCCDSINLVYGSISRGSQDSLCAIDGQLLGIAEQAVNPWTVDFVFKNVERLQYFSFYGKYDGSTSHNIHVLAYNVNTLTWDFVGEFSQSDIYRWYNWPLFLPNNYINSGEVKIRIEHQDTGITSHRMYFDYVEVNFGGTGGGNFITAGTVDLMPYKFVTGTNVQAGIQQIIDKDVNQSDSIITLVDYVSAGMDSLAVHRTEIETIKTDYVRKDSINSYEVYVTSAGTTNYPIPFEIESHSMVFYNGIILPNSLWLGTGTTTLILDLDIKVNDYIKIFK